MTHPKTVRLDYKKLNSLKIGVPKGILPPRAPSRESSILLREINEQFTVTARRSVNLPKAIQSTMKQHAARHPSEFGRFSLSFSA